MRVSNKRLDEIIFWRIIHREKTVFLTHTRERKMKKNTASKETRDDLTGFIDPSISPADDFYAHVNKKWGDENPIPAKEARWGAFFILREDIKNQLKMLLEELAGGQNFLDGGNKQKLCDLYRIGMDEERIEREGIAPIQHILESIKKISSPQEAVLVFARLHRSGSAPFWTPDVFSDTKKSDINRLYLEQAGLSLPDRDYYFKDDKKFLRIRKAFLAYAREMHLLLRDTPEEAAKNAKAILALETRLARASLTATERRDPEKQYHPMTVAELSSFAPDVSWPAYLKHLGVSGTPEQVIVRQPEFIKECNQIIREAEEDEGTLENLKTYLRWRFVGSVAEKLSRDFADLQFRFYGTTLTGITEQRPRWERVLGALNEVLGEALGKLYVERYFPLEAKEHIHELVGDLQEVFRGRIEMLPWMGEQTKARALAKLATFNRKLGYPEKWRDYAKFQVLAGDSYVEAYLRGCAVESLRQLRKIDKEVDKAEWSTTPQTVNAYNNPLWNEIVFPAGILQPPFFDPHADDAVNYGAIGSVIGHELTHGFDDEGSKYDEQGNLADWWAPEDRKRFMEKASVLVKQFNSCTFFGMSVNGELTLGENIADLGGLVIAYEALQKALARKGKPGLIDGFTPEQRFFLSYARTERSTVREEYARQCLVADPHSPSPLRVNAILSNMQEFHEAFGCKEGCAMYRSPSERAEIW